MNRTYKASPDYTIPNVCKIGFSSGTPAITNTDLENPVPLDNTESVDTCDAIAGWSASGTNSVSLNTTTFKEGTGSLNLIKSDATSVNISISKTTTSRDFTGKTFFIWIYLDETTVYDELETTNAVILRFGSDAGAYYQENYDKSELSAGWNQLYFTSATADSTTGVPVITAMDYTFIQVTTNTATDTWIAAKCMVDDIKVASADDFIGEIQASYPTIDETNLEVESRFLISTVQANGSLVDGFGMFNSDATRKLHSRETFTDESKSNTDEFLFIITDRVL